MKCVLLLLAFAALSHCYPSGHGQRNININEDGTIVITGTGGKRIVINKGIGNSGQRTVDISVSGPNIPTKRIQINEQNELEVRGQGEFSDEYLRDKRSSKDSRRQKSQGDVLTQILKGYQGDVDQVTYQKLLREIDDAVRTNQLSQSVYDVLQGLNQVQEQQGLWERQQGLVPGQRQGDVLDLLRERAIEQELEQLQQQQQLLRVPVGQQQIGQRITGGIPSGIRGLDIVQQQGVGRTLWGVPRLLTGQLGQQVIQSIPVQLEQIVQEER